MSAYQSSRTKKKKVQFSLERKTSSSLAVDDCHACDPEQMIAAHFPEGPAPNFGSLNSEEDLFDQPKNYQSVGQRNTEIEIENQVKQFLIIPSAIAGICLGVNNYFLGYISFLGPLAALEFSVGAFTVTTTYKCLEAIRFKYSHGSFFPIEHSNFFELNKEG